MITEMEWLVITKGINVQTGVGLCHVVDTSGRPVPQTTQRTMLLWMVLPLTAPVLDG